MLSAYQSKRGTMYYNYKVTLFVFGLFYLLLQSVKFGSGEELPKGDVESVTKFLYSDYRNIPSGAVHHAVSGGGRHSGKSSQSVYIQMPFAAQLPKAHNYNILDTHSITSKILYKSIRCRIYALA